MPAAENASATSPGPAVKPTASRRSSPHRFPVFAEREHRLRFDAEFLLNLAPRLPEQARAMTKCRQQQQPVIILEDKMHACGNP